MKIVQSTTLEGNKTGVKIYKGELVKGWGSRKNQRKASWGTTFLKEDYVFYAEIGTVAFATFLTDFLPSVRKRPFQTYLATL